MRLCLRGDFPWSSVVTVAERSFIYLFISLRGLSSCRRDNAACLFVPSQQTCSLKSTMGRWEKHPQGEENFLQQMDVFWLPFLMSVSVRRGSSSAFGCSPTGVSLISLHVELSSTRLGPVLHVNSLSFCLRLYLQSNTDGHATTTGRDGRGVSSQWLLAVTAVLRPSLLCSFVETDAHAAPLIYPPSVEHKLLFASCLRSLY